MHSAQVQRIQKDYPWVQTPLVVQAPLRLITFAEIAVEVSKAGGIGFVAAGTDPSHLDSDLQTASSLVSTHTPPVPTASSPAGPLLPLGVGFIVWGCSLSVSLAAIQKHRPAAAWLFAPSSAAQLREWSQEIRRVSPQTKIWVQVGSVADAMAFLEAAEPDVLVLQGTDAGGHGLVRGASVISLVPEVVDAVDSYFNDRPAADQQFGKPLIVAAGGITESRSAAAALVLGAQGIAMGTRFLASHEVHIARGYQEDVLRATDGGQSTGRTKLYDALRGTVWMDTYNGRGILNKTFTDAESGMDEQENKRLYEESLKKGDMGWGPEGRLTAYAGSGVGLVKEVKGAGEIVEEIRRGVAKVLGGVGGRERGGT
ncbi:oxidoreductase 2-nitropropane dioxygenase [Westerdykella ornata]|uniref:Oxidoreductase 2-nitropropane dioxygenase n=1 Tax=Westerdykella ornata TaxID=318751 RepID=A0A6A6JW97_WESOR|nr:oxidoreductase 2-nitropropane dioxygenase [Westerdykella ornata]KAF2280677.1 oxidoreductase 2-nitropropane dioxygenase [Westerdykella ornata]